ncbi:acyl-homoserine-lactone synthase [Nereida sp. MMG025]|uniref:acyl-homoserine-lactone synthase n=1 Tax=Nereida sp. MMG025 TaxID=2909981 RepID=UPI001F2CB254|nr:acyl-homoserine-lactone synthase [Nereida sp. MMG025]MCF6445520.1 autoinducer synthase [Nereida sp. MMG025]
MLRYIYADHLSDFPALSHSMFRDRATQFVDRLGWDIGVDANGEERDEYDALNPLYVIWELPDGRHGGSMRFLPSTGPIMVNDHFGHILDGTTIQSPLIWECTRFCLSPNADRRAAAALVLGAGEVMKRFSLNHYVGVFDPRMERIYRLYGVTPDVIGCQGEGADRIAVGLWEMQQDAWPKTFARLGITAAQSDAWFKASRDTLRAKIPPQPDAPSGPSCRAPVGSRHDTASHPIF